MTGLSTSTFGDLGGAVSDIFGAIGDKAEAGAYSEASTLAGQNAQIAAASGRIQQVQSDRQIYQSIGGSKADVAGAGLAASGSALDVIRSSTQQGALQKALIANQTSINVNGYQEEASAYQGMASAASAASTGGFLGGLLKIGAAAMTFSDARLKTNIRLIELRPDGIGRYLFNYRGQPTVYQGVLAQEVVVVHPEAVMLDPNSGFMMVDYAAIGEQMMEVGRA